MSTALDLDIAAMVGEIESPACEHSQHSTHATWHANGGERYIRLSSPCGHTKPDVIRVYCLKWLTESDLLECPTCAAIFPLAGHYVDLGPVGGSPWT